MRLRGLLIQLGLLGLLQLSSVGALSAEEIPATNLPPKSADVQKSSKARITVDEPTFDFGIVPQRSTVTHSFKVRNTGEDTLIISRIQST